MKIKGQIINLVIVGMTLGTTWAIRGQFGHEQGAAWAGAIGAISIILIAKRGDWYSRLFKATLAAAIGWGLGGMMSYGRVVGFGRGVDFVNIPLSELKYITDRDGIDVCLPVITRSIIVQVLAEISEFCQTINKTIY